MKKVFQLSKKFKINLTKKKDSFNHEDNVNLLSKRNVYHTPWFNLIEKKFSNREQPFYSLKMKDYVTVIARTIDKRIILIDGETVGAVNRVPAAGDSRSNMHAGGTPKKTTLTKNDHLICKTISPFLKEKGLFFVGIDIIGKFITEINVTSPTGIREINKFNKIKIEQIFWDKLEKKLFNH